MPRKVQFCPETGMMSVHNRSVREYFLLITEGEIKKFLDVCKKEGIVLPAKSKAMLKYQCFMLPGEKAPIVFIRLGALGAKYWQTWVVCNGNGADSITSCFLDFIRSEGLTKEQGNRRAEIRHDL